MSPKVQNIHITTNPETPYIDIYINNEKIGYIYMQDKPSLHIEKNKVSTVVVK